MSRRTLSSIVVFGLLLVLFVVAMFVPVPYVTMSPGPTVERARGDRRQVDRRGAGAQDLPDQGPAAADHGVGDQPGPHDQPGRGDAGVVRRHPRGLPQATSSTRRSRPRRTPRPQSSVEMVVLAGHRGRRRADRARLQAAAARRGPRRDPESPGRRQARGRATRSSPSTAPRSRTSPQVTKLVQANGTDKDATFVVRRAGKDRGRSACRPARVHRADRSERWSACRSATGYDFPFDVSGPAQRADRRPQRRADLRAVGLRHAHPRRPDRRQRDRRHGNHHARRGRVGPIGGIQQKIVAAADAGAKVFLVPPANCSSALARGTSRKGRSVS